LTDPESRRKIIVPELEMTHAASAAASDDLPPIVLLVEDDADTLAMFAAYFESSGVWVATSTQPGEALEAVEELKPDLVVTDLGFQGKPLGVGLVHTLKTSETTKGIPLIVLTGDSVQDLPPDTRSEANLCLVKPVLPDALLTSVRELIAQSQALRKRLHPVRGKPTPLGKWSTDPGAMVHPLASPLPGRARPCPECATPLEWVEEGRIGGVTYDYYRWCLKGCGLYCYDRESARWVKLA
jgi:CheY-like chemotaxis protein